MAIRRGSFGHATKGGVVAGLIGGLALSIWLLISALIQGHDIWMGMKGAAAPFIGPEQVTAGFEAGPVLLGLLSHFAVSVAWAVPFAWLVYGLAPSTTVLLGALWGVVVWLGMFYVLLPVLGLADLVAGMPSWLAILEHVVFGLAAALGFLPYQRAARRRTGVVPTEPATGTPPR